MVRHNAHADSYRAGIFILVLHFDPYIYEYLKKKYEEEMK